VKRLLLLCYALAACGPAATETIICQGPLTAGHPRLLSARYSDVSCAVLESGMDLAGGSTNERGECAADVDVDEPSAGRFVFSYEEKTDTAIAQYVDPSSYWHLQLSGYPCQLAAEVAP
jgi:hypothetical protein